MSHRNLLFAISLCLCSCKQEDIDAFNRESQKKEKEVLTVPIIEKGNIITIGWNEKSGALHSADNEEILLKNLPEILEKIERTKTIKLQIPIVFHFMNIENQTGIILVTEPKQN
jgi:hypothetical protein